MQVCMQQFQGCAGQDGQGVSEGGPSDADVKADMDKFCPLSKKLMTCTKAVPEQCSTFIAPLKQAFGSVEALCNEEGYWDSGADKATTKKMMTEGTKPSTVKYSENQATVGDDDDKNGAGAVAASLVATLAAAVAVSML